MLSFAVPGQPDRLEAGTQMSPLLSAFAASLLTRAATATGAALVFLTPRLPQRAMAGLLIAASLLMGWAAWSGLLVPALEGAGERFTAGSAFLSVAIAAVIGAVIVRVLRRRLVGIEDHGPVLGRQLFLVMTLHHVPEGMAVGLTVAAAALGDTSAAAGSAALVLAMALHNSVEGALVSLPLRQDGMGRGRAWMRGQLSGVAEIAGALLGATAVGLASAVLPWALAAAGGAMVAVVAGDLLPELRHQLRPVRATR